MRPASSSPSRSALTRCRVTSSSGTCSVTKSDCRSSSSMPCALRTLEGRRQAASTVISGSNPIDLHSELDRRVGDDASDRAEADDPQRPARQFHARELLLPVFDAAARDPVCRARATRRSRAPVSMLRAASSNAVEHELLHGVGVRAGRIEHRRAALRHFRDGNVVGARAGAADRADGRRDRHRVHVARSHENRVGSIDGVAHANIALRGSGAIRCPRSG